MLAESSDIQRFARRDVERLLLTASGTGSEGHAGATAPDPAVTAGTEPRAPRESLGRRCPWPGWQQELPTFARSEQLARMSQPITSGKEVSGKAVTPR